MSEERTMPELCKFVKRSLLNEKVLKILIQNNIQSTLDFLREDIEKLMTLTKLSLSEILNIRTEIFQNCSAPLMNAKSLYVCGRHKKLFWDTGISSLNVITGNGLPLGYITEICGLADSGKTQLCIQLSINCAKNVDDTILYIDTKGDFSSVNIEKNLQYCGYNTNDIASIMNKIKVYKVWNMEELNKLFEMFKNGVIVIDKLCLIIIDSMPSLMLQHLGEDSKVGLHLLNKFVNSARYLCKHLNLNIICVNIVTRWIEQDFTEVDEGNDQSHISIVEPYWKETKSRCMGRYWQHIPALVLSMEKVQSKSPLEQINTLIKITVTKSILGKFDSSCNLQINAYGVTYFLCLLYCVAYNYIL